MTKISIDGKPLNKWLKDKKNKPLILQAIWSGGWLLISYMLFCWLLRFTAGWTHFVARHISAITPGETAIMAEIVILGVAWVLYKAICLITYDVRD